MVEQVVGLQFVTQGAEKATRDITEYSRGTMAVSKEASNAAKILNTKIGKLFEAADAYQKNTANITKLNAIMAQNAREAQAVVNAATGVTNAYTSAEASAAVFARELEKGEAVMRRQAKAFGDAVREANTYATANKSAQDSASVFSTELRKQEAEFSKVARANQDYMRSLQESGLSNKSAADSAAVFEQEIQRAEKAMLKQSAAFGQAVRDANQYAATNKSAADSASVFEQEMRRQDAAIERLSMKYKPLYAASKQYENALNDVNQAHALGVISTRQHEDAVERLNLEYQQFQAGTAGWENQFVQGGQRSARSVNRFGMYAQQVGYQVGDFFVQVQSGTNAFVAFGQQATQLAGLLPGLAGAIVGIGISVGTAILSTWSRTRAEIKETNLEFENVGSTIESLESVRLDSIGVEFRENAEKASAAFRDILASVERAELAALKTQLAAPLNAVLAEIRKFDVQSRLVGRFGDVDFESSLGLKSRQEALFLATQLSRLEGETREELLAQSQSIAEALRLRGIMTPQVDSMLRALAEELGLMQEIEQKAEDVSDVDVGKGIRKAVSDAVRLSEELGVSLRAAQMIADIRSPRKPSTVTGFDPNDPRSGVAGALDMRFDYGTTSPFDPSRQPKDRTSLGSGGSNVVDITEIIAARREQIMQERELVGLSGALRLEKEIYFDLLKQNRDANVQLTDAELQAEAQRLAGLQQVTELLKEQQQVQEQLAQTIQSSMESAFMSITDGTKSAEDAFRDMARAVIAELYKVLVVQQLVGQFKSGGGGVLGLLAPLFGFANGGAFQGGNVVPFASGGVVGGPTTFPMNGGKTGLMGEAGPEAIMPLKRGKDGKLGVAAEGGGAVNIVQNFNFTANGDESVKRIIAQEAPKIANLTQQQIVRERRRGGTMKTTFG